MNYETEKIEALHCVKLYIDAFEYGITVGWSCYDKLCDCDKAVLVHSDSVFLWN